MIVKTPVKKIPLDITLKDTIQSVKEKLQKESVGRKRKEVK
jgi:hypothetical protein